jgi:hypothetical protein
VKLQPEIEVERHSNGHVLLNLEGVWVSLSPEAVRELTRQLVSLYGPDAPQKEPSNGPSAP